MRRANVFTSSFFKSPSLLSCGVHAPRNVNRLVLSVDLVASLLAFLSFYRSSGIISPHRISTLLIFSLALMDGCRACVTREITCVVNQFFYVNVPLRQRIQIIAEDRFLGCFTSAKQSSSGDPTYPRTRIGQKKLFQINSET